MRKEIELSKDYTMILKIMYVKNTTTGKKRYEIKSKIVHREDYVKDEDCIGEIEGEYFAEISVRIPYSLLLKKYYRIILNARIERKIRKFVNKSKRLVDEWELRNEMLMESEKHIENYYIE